MWRSMILAISLVAFSVPALADSTTVTHKDGSSTTIQTWSNRGMSIVTKYDKQGKVVSTNTVNSGNHGEVVSRYKR